MDDARVVRPNYKGSKRAEEERVCGFIWGLLIAIKAATTVARSRVLVAAATTFHLHAPVCHQ